MPKGACIRKFPYASPDAAPWKLEAKNISIKTLIWLKPDEIDAGIISLKILLSSFLNKLKVDFNLKRPILFISEIWTTNWIKVPVKVAKASNPV